MNLKNFIIKKHINKILAGIFVICIFLIANMQYDAKTFSVGFKRIQNLLARMYPIDFTILGELKQPIIENLNIALFS